MDIIPRDELKEEGLGIARAVNPTAGASTESIPYYFVPTQAPGMIMGKPVDQATAAIYAAQQPHPMAYMAWHQPSAQTQQTEDQGNQQQGSMSNTEC